MLDVELYEGNHRGQLKPMGRCHLPESPVALEWPILWPNIDAEGRSLAWRAGDLCARWVLCDLQLPLFDAEELGGCTIVNHAMIYLEDRLAYELYPAPRGKIRVIADEESDSQDLGN
jgi:hypothetical protein